MAVFYVIPLTKATTKEVYNPLLNGKERLINEASWKRESASP
jgi:hypothetical protein